MTNAVTVAMRYIARKSRSRMDSPFELSRTN
jgi:hypothetical protein